MDTLNLLHNCHLCKDLGRQELEALAAIALFQQVNAGGLIFFEGDQATGFYALLSGSVRIYKASPDGREYTLHRITPGQMFAEAAMFRGNTFPANCMATTDSSLAFFPKDRFVELIKNSPEMSLKMIAALSGFVKDFNRQIEYLSLKEVPARLASHLLREADLANSPKVTLDTTKTELARSLGTISETLSRNLRKMRELGMIRVDGKNITILDSSRLQAIADGEKI